MIFNTDKQTLDDLNIFGKQGGESIYSIFNQTSTVAGATVLEELFNYPLADVESIGRRSRIIQFFADERILFPFQATLFDGITPYLNNTDERTKLSMQDESVVKKLGNLIAVDLDTEAIYNGIISVVTLLKELKYFVYSFEVNAGHPYLIDLDGIRQILAEPSFKTLLLHEKHQKLSKAEMVEYDVIFRFRHHDLLKKIMDYLAYLDVYCTVAKVAINRGFVFAKVLPQEAELIQLEEVYHPLLTHTVANTIQIDRDSNVIFLTGANMAGKSTFMKSLSIALFLAHMGFPVAARRMEFSVLDGIYTTINLPDNLGIGASHFYSEVLRAKKIARELKTRKLFVLFDELFRGTNVKDACEATISFTQACAGKKGSVFVISTHIIEAGAVLSERCENINFVYLPTQMEGNVPVYTYQLKKGITEDRHGMVIIKNEGILEILATGIHKLNQI